MNNENNNLLIAANRLLAINKIIDILLQKTNELRLKILKLVPLKNKPKNASRKWKRFSKRKVIECHVH